MLERVIYQVEGKPRQGQFDMSFYSDTHDVPALYIEGQIICLGNGWGEYDKDEGWFGWKFDPEKTYRITIEEVLGA